MLHFPELIFLASELFIIQFFKNVTDLFLHSSAEQSFSKKDVPEILVCGKVAYGYLL